MIKHAYAKPLQVQLHGKHMDGILLHIHMYNHIHKVSFRNFIKGANLTIAELRGVKTIHV